MGAGNRHGAEAARRAHNPEDLGSKPSAGIFQFAGLQEPATLSPQQPTLHRDGAEEARGTHNPEDTGSNPVSGIYHSAGLQEPATLSLQQHPSSRHGAAVSARSS